MSASFTKLFSSIVTSTVWREDLETKVTWVTMLALADQHGEIQGSIPGLAHLAGVSLEGCRNALQRFLAPDEYSRTKDHEGRRIEEIPGGWAILNYASYRRLASKEEAIEKTRERVRRHRERKADVTTCNGMKRDVTPNRTEAEAEAEEITPAKAGEGAPTRPAHKEPRHGKSGTRIPQGWRPTQAGREYAADLGLDPDSTADAFVDWWTAANGPNAIKRDWDAAFRTWCRRDAARPMGAAANRPVRPSRGGDAFFEQLSAIASRPGSDEPDRY